MAFGEIYKYTWWGETVSGGFGEAYRNLIGDERFIISVKTDNAGTSTSTQFTLPWTGTYDVDWGDGTVEEGVVDSQTHTYSTAGTYDIAVTAATGQIRFNGGGDRRKLIDIKNWGDVAWTSMNGAFYVCSNTIVSAEDSLILPSDCNATFGGCTSLTTLDVSSWDTSSVTRMDYMFYNCSNLKADLSGLDIASVTNLNLFASGTNINDTGTTTNYDNTLISWAAQSPNTGLNIHFGDSRYSNAAAAARELLTRAVVDGGYGWTITDGGGVDLLDTYTGAAAAYSLRTIKSSTTKVVRVRADVVGQPEQDFTAVQITDGTLATFVGAGNNGYVVTWYDQSGLGNHATQGTASNQPQIVSSGVVITENGLPTLDFDGTNDNLKSTFSSSISTNTISIVSNPSDGDFIFDDSITTNVNSIYTNTTNNIRLYNSATGVIYHSISPSVWGNQHLISSITDSTNSKIGIDGSFTTGTMSSTLVGATLGSAPSNILHLNGTIQEVIVYGSNQNANLTNIESNINGYYDIY